MSGQVEQKNPKGEAEPIDPIMKYFEFSHLPPKLQEVSGWFHGVAHTIQQTLPRSAERSVALRKLLEAKDAAVRAALG